MRLDQFISQSCVISRKAARQHIRQGRITVNTHTVTQAAKQIGPTDTVWLQQQRLQLPGALYLMLNKPAGIISATCDSAQRTVLDLIDHPHRHTLHVVGRLDKDSTGLLLLSNDGQWSHQLMSPRHHVAKTYRVHLDKPLSEETAHQLEQGILLKGEQRPTRPARLQLKQGNPVWITLSEGRYHQVKRMFAAVGYHVTALHRERIGPWTLDHTLAAGEWKAFVPDKTAHLPAALMDHDCPPLGKVD